MTTGAVRVGVSRLRLAGVRGTLQLIPCDFQCVLRLRNNSVRTSVSSQSFLLRNAINSQKFSTGVHLAWRHGLAESDMAGRANDRPAVFRRGLQSYSLNARDNLSLSGFNR
jgi:hypothetical protein